MTTTAIKLDNVSKRFKLYHDAITGPVAEFLFFWKRENYYRDFLAVKDVSLEIKRGEVVGIIGPNGAGKTTLLKLIAGLLPLDGGSIEINGRVTALLALGVGVHFEFTARENILYGGMLLGMSKAEVLRKMTDIIEFAELGDYVDRPFRTYSSGMKARLLFAISMSVDPEILIVDEALATGDYFFVQKCYERIRALCQSGATIVFVSHNFMQIEQICQRAYFMAHGSIVDEGESSHVVNAYKRWVFEKGKPLSVNGENSDLQMIGGSGEVFVTNVRLLTSDGQETTSFVSGESMKMHIYYRNTMNSNMNGDLFIGFLLAGDSSYVGEINTVNNVEALGSIAKRATFTIEHEGIINISMEPLLLLNNHYTLWIIIYNADNSKCYCEYKGVSPFFVARAGNPFPRGPVFWQPCKITTEPG